MRPIPKDLDHKLAMSIRTPQQIIEEMTRRKKEPRFTIDQMLTGKIFSNNSLPTALSEAMNFATSEGIVLNMPEFIAAKAKAERNHVFWLDWYTVLTEENIGIDKKGSFYNKGDSVLVVMHGGGILTPNRIQQAYDEGLLDYSAKYRDEEFDALLEGRLLDGTSFPLYRLEEIKDGRSGLPHQFGVVMPYSLAQGTKSGHHKKKPFLENPLVLARTAGSHDSLEAFYEKAKASDGDLGNYHPFSGRDAMIPQGRVLFVDGTYGGLSGYNDLSSSGRFVGVAPEAKGKEL